MMTTTATLPLEKPIRFVYTCNEPPPKRARIAAACVSCQTRKIKCKGEKPACSTCELAGRLCGGYKAAVKKGQHESGNSTNPTPETLDLRETLHADTTTTPEGAKVEVEKLDLVSGDLRASPSSTSREVELDANKTSSPDEWEPYFRYFGATAIVPGYKCMLAGPNYSSHRPKSPSTASLSSCSSGGTTHESSSHFEGQSPPEMVREYPYYNKKDARPVHELILSLIDTFFTYLGCNYPFLYKDKDNFKKRVQARKEPAILVNAICGLAARFSDHELLRPAPGENLCRSNYGYVFTDRARNEVVGTFTRPTVKATQACLLLAYEAFGANEDSCLWIFLGLAIRMVQDLGLHRLDIIQLRARRYARRTRTSVAVAEQERIDTFWAVFILDRVISSGVGRPGSLRRKDVDLPFPDLRANSIFPALLVVLRNYGTASDRMNETSEHCGDEALPGLIRTLSIWGGDFRAAFDFRHRNTQMMFTLDNMRRYDANDEGVDFVLFHLWLHTTIMLTMRPSLMSPYDREKDYVSPVNHERCMDSATTVVSILEIVATKFPGTIVRNPFTSQPIYIAACAWLNERDRHRNDVVKSNMSERNYRTCYAALQRLQVYWGGIGYILAALDQKHKGVPAKKVQPFLKADLERTASHVQAGSWSVDDTATLLAMAKNSEDVSPKYYAVLKMERQDEEEREKQREREGERGDFDTSGLDITSAPSFCGTQTLTTNLETKTKLSPRHLQRQKQRQLQRKAGVGQFRHAAPVRRATWTAPTFIGPSSSHIQHDIMLAHSSPTQAIDLDINLDTPNVPFAFDYMPDAPADIYPTMSYGSGAPMLNLDLVINPTESLDMSPTLLQDDDMHDLDMMFFRGHAHDAQYMTQGQSVDPVVWESDAALAQGQPWLDGGEYYHMDAE